MYALSIMYYNTAAFDIVLLPLVVHKVQEHTRCLDGVDTVVLQSNCTSNEHACLHKYAHAQLNKCMHSLHTHIHSSYVHTWRYIIALGLMHNICNTCNHIYMYTDAYKFTYIH